MNERPELSKKSKYYIPKHRFYELKHFCLQYPDWINERFDYLPSSGDLYFPIRKNSPGDKTGNKAIRHLEIEEKIRLVKRASALCDPEIGTYIFKAVTQGRSFNYLKTMDGMPCERDMFYDRYRRFFWILDRLSRQIQLL